MTDDGAETDLDLGHYERFLDENFQQANSTSSGQIYEEVIRKERRGDFLGGTIQPIPHVPNEIRRRIQEAGRTLDAEVVIVEVGGTVGDMEGQPFLEAISQMRHHARTGRDRLDPRHAAALHRLHARAEDEAHAALGARAAFLRHTAGRDHHPLRPSGTRGAA